jgi:hypothetical protein
MKHIAPSSLSAALVAVFAVVVSVGAAPPAATNYVIYPLENGNVATAFADSPPTIALMYKVDATNGVVYDQAFLKTGTSANTCSTDSSNAVSGPTITVSPAGTSATFGAKINISTASSGSNTISFCHRTMSYTSQNKQTLMYERYTIVNISYTINNGFSTAITTTVANVGVTTAIGDAGTVVGVTALATPTTVKVGEQFTVTLASTNTNFVLSGLINAALNGIPILVNSAVVSAWNGIVTTTGNNMISVTLPFSYYTEKTSVTITGTAMFIAKSRALAKGSDAPVTQPFQVEIGLEQVSKDGASAAFVVKSIMATGAAALVALAL